MTFIYFLRQDKVLFCRTVGLKLTAAVLVPVSQVIELQIVNHHTHPLWLHFIWSNKINRVFKTRFKIPNLCAQTKYVQRWN